MNQTACRFAMSTLGCAGLAVAVLTGTIATSAPDVPGSADDTARAPTVKREALLKVDLAQPVVVRAVDPDDTSADGRVFRIQPNGDLSAVGDLSCKRVAVAPHGGGLCLAVARNGIDYDAIVFDSAGRRRLARPIQGVPDRARISRNGRYGAFTAFPHAIAPSYFEHTSTYSTLTRILDLDTGETVLKFENLPVERAGRRVDTRAAEFWGVTFAGDDRFYATMAIGYRHYLIAGRVDRPLARVVRRVVECPALSPDGTRIAYKRRVGRTQQWELHVLDLRNGVETPLAERRSIDDQPEWLSSSWVAYSDDHDVYAVRADGSGAPVRLAGDATSASSAPGEGR